MHHLTITKAQARGPMVHPVIILRSELERMAHEARRKDERRESGPCGLRVCDMDDIFDGQSPALTRSVT